MDTHWICVLVGALLCPWSIQSEGETRRDPYDIHDYKDHPCIRTCLEGGAPMTCRYYFLVEHFTTMSAACYDCPNKRSHCSLPQCVTGNGLLRPVLAVNRMVPGPALHVCKGDTLEVLVDNRMELGEGTTIHWHGIRQKGTPYMDGMNMITQCPITKWSKMTYRFQVDEAGTYFWHSHDALQRSDGLFGDLVVRQPLTYDPHSGLYDFDLVEHAIMLNDWAPSMSVESFVNLFYKGENANPSGILVNGRGRAIGAAKIPYEEFRVRAGMRYRFRVIYSGILNCPIYVRVDGHKLLMIASDGRDFEPVEVDSFTIYSGERYDFVLQAKGEAEKHNGSYWMRFKGYHACQSSKAIEAAILRYEGGGADEPEGEVTYSNTMPQKDELTLSDGSGISSKNNIQIVDLKSAGPDKNYRDLIDKPDKQFYVSLVRSTMPDKRFMTPTNPECKENSSGSIALRMETPSGATNSSDMTSYGLDQSPQGLEPLGNKCDPTERYNLQLNYITGRLPPAPPLTQFNDIPWKLLCNGDNIMRDCSKEACQCVHTLSFEQGQLVEIVLVSPRAKYGVGQLIHPMHIHGHSARVVSMFRMANVTVDSVKAMDARGEINRVRSKAPYKDTTPVGDHSVVILRFRADNPGFWFFHCHIELHTELGMALVLQSGKPEEMPQPPEPFPRCHPWSPDDDAMTWSLAETPRDTTLPSDSSGTEGGATDQVTQNDTTRDFITGESVAIVAIAVVIALALPATVLALLVWYRRRKQKKTSMYRLLGSCPSGFVNSLYSSTEDTS